MSLAILRVIRRRDGAALPSFVPLTLANSDAEAEGVQLWVLGYGQQQSDRTNTRNTTTGILSGRHNGKHGNWIRTDADVLRGHSGGPVVNQKGEAVGWCVKSHADRITDLERSDLGMLEASGGLHAVRPMNDALPEMRAAAEAAAETG